MLAWLILRLLVPVVTSATDRSEMDPGALGDAEAALLSESEGAGGVSELFASPGEGPRVPQEAPDSLLLEIVDGATDQPLVGAVLAVWDREAGELFALDLKGRSSARLNLSRGALAVWKEGYAPRCLAVDGEQGHLRLALQQAGRVVLEIEAGSIGDGERPRLALIPPDWVPAAGLEFWRVPFDLRSQRGGQPTVVFPPDLDSLARSPWLRRLLGAVGLGEERARGVLLPLEDKLSEELLTAELIRWTGEPDGDGRIVWDPVPVADGYRIGLLGERSVTDLVGGGSLRFDPPFEAEHVQFDSTGRMQVTPVQGNLSGAFGVLRGQTVRIGAEALDSVSRVLGRLVPLDKGWDERPPDVHLIDARVYRNPVNGKTWNERVTLAKTHADAEGRFSFSDVPTEFDKVIRASWRDREGGMHFAVELFSVSPSESLDLGDVYEEQGNRLTIQTVVRDAPEELEVPFEVQVMASPLDRRSPEKIITTLGGVLGERLELYGLPEGTAAISFSFEHEQAAACGVQLNERPRDAFTEVTGDTTVLVELDALGAEGGPVAMRLPPLAGVENVMAEGKLWEEKTGRCRDLSFSEQENGLLEESERIFPGERFHLFVTLRDRATGELFNWVLDGELSAEELHLDPVPLRWIEGARVEGSSEPSRTMMMPVLVDPTAGIDGLYLTDFVNADDRGRFSMTALFPDRDYAIGDTRFHTGPPGSVVQVDLSNP